MRNTLLTRPVFKTSPFDEAIRSFWSDFEVRSPHLTSSWSDDGWTLTADLPGVPDEAIAVSVAGRNLHVGVKTDQLAWERTIQLRPGLDPDTVSARYVNGRLTVHVGASAQPEARSIAIDTAPAPVAIEAVDDSSNDESSNTPTDES